MRKIFVSLAAIGLMFVAGPSWAASYAETPAADGTVQPVAPAMAEAEVPGDPATVWLILIPLLGVLPLPWPEGRRSRIPARNRFI